MAAARWAMKHADARLSLCRFGSNFAHAAPSRVCWAPTDCRAALSGIVIDWSAWFFAIPARASLGRDDEGEQAASAMASVGQVREVRLAFAFALMRSANRLPIIPAELSSDDRGGFFRSGAIHPIIPKRRLRRIRDRNGLKAMLAFRKAWMTAAAATGASERTWASRCRALFALTLK